MRLVLAISTYLMGLSDKNNSNSCLGQVLGHSEAKSINKFFFFVFSPKIHDFLKKKFK